MNITVYQKTGCPWAAAVTKYLDSLSVEYRVKDVTQNPDFRAEIEELSGQSKSPTLIIDDEILPDAGVEDVQRHMDMKLARAGK